MFVRTAVSRLGGLRTSSKLIRSPNTLASVSFNASHQSSGLLNVPASPLSTSFLLSTSSSSSSSSSFGCSSTSFVSSSSFWAPSRCLLSTAEAKEEGKQVGDSEAEVSRKKPETVEESLELFDSQAKMIRKILKENKRPIVPRPTRILQMLYQWENLDQARKREFYEVLALSQKEGVTYEGSTANAIINFFREHHPTSAVEILRRLTPKTISKKIRKELKVATHSGPLDDLTTQLETEQEAEEEQEGGAELKADGQEPFFRPRRYYRFYAGALAVSRLIKTLAQDQHPHMVQRAFEVLDNVYLKYYEFSLDARGFKTILPSFVLASFRLPQLYPKVLTIANSLVTKIEAKEIEFEASSLPLKAITSFAVCHRDADLLARLETVLLPLIPAEFTGYKAAVLLALNKADTAAALFKAEANSRILPEHTSSLSLIVSVADFLHPQHPDGALTDRLNAFNETTSLPPVSPRAFDVKTLNYTTFN